MKMAKSVEARLKERLAEVEDEKNSREEEYKKCVLSFEFYVGI